jgi:hypothetical protein
MKKFVLIPAAFICMLMLTYCRPKKSPKDQLHSHFNQDLDSLILMNEELLGLARSRQKAEVYQYSSAIQEDRGLCGVLFSYYDPVGQWCPAGRN